MLAADCSVIDAKNSACAALGWIKEAAAAVAAAVLWACGAACGKGADPPGKASVLALTFEQPHDPNAGDGGMGA